MMPTLSDWIGGACLVLIAYGLLVGLPLIFGA
jgi:hypothetical protein